MDLDINNSPLRRQLRAEGAEEKDRLWPLLERCEAELAYAVDHYGSDEVQEDLLADLRRELGKED